MAQDFEVTIDCAALKQPRLGAEALFTIHAGAVLSVLEDYDAEFYRVAFEGRPVYVSKAFGRLVDATEPRESGDASWQGSAPAIPAAPAVGTSAGAALGAQEYATFWRRLGGYLLDAIIVLVATFVITIIVSLGSNPAFTPVISFALGITYYVSLNAYGGTPGKRMVGIRLEDAETGANIGIPRALLRYIVAIVSGLALLIGYLWVFWDDRRQTWHDKAASSVVVYT